MILVFKLLMTPLLIGAVTLAGRRWGPAVSGLLTGLPLTSGPVSVFLALQYGREFAARAAVGNMVGQATVCIFCLAYSLTARRWRWPASALTGVAAFAITTVIWNRVTWTLLPACGTLLLIIALVARLIPRQAGTCRRAWSSPPLSWCC